MEMNRGKQNISIAVFDSGIGGLNLLKECVKAMPAAKYFYLADNYNVPYGTKGKEEIFHLVKSKIESVKSEGLSAAVIACNTATASCIDDLRAEFSFPILGIQPAVKPAAQHGGKCLVLATPATVKSESFKNLLACYGNAGFTVHSCAHLAEYIEKNVLDLKGNLPEGLLPDVKADSVVLGCTHYVYIKDIVQSKYNCKIFDGITGTVNRLRSVLGISDHFGGNTGISDHCGPDELNITFLGGDFVKNALIFENILNK